MPRSCSIVSYGWTPGDGTKIGKCVTDDHVSVKRGRTKALATSDESALLSASAAQPTDKTEKILSHPSDVVFYYDEPYRPMRTYINADLKSYKRGSITSTAIASAIESLALTLECAELSQEWRDKFVHDKKSYDIVGLLFIYNHDGEYDKDFDQVLAKVNHERLRIPEKSRILVFGPSHIKWLDNIRHDLSGLYSEHILPHEDRWSYYYPDLAEEKNSELWPCRHAGDALRLKDGRWSYVVPAYTATNKIRHRKAMSAEASNITVRTSTIRDTRLRVRGYGAHRGDACLAMVILQRKNHKLMLRPWGLKFLVGLSQSLY